MGVWNFLFKHNKLIHQLDISGILVDMHSHLIPGIDDGVKDLSSALTIIKYLQSLGYKKIITTPHIMADIYKNTPEIILSEIEFLKKVVKDEGIDIEIEAAAEYLLDESFKENIQKNNFLTLKDSYVLVELPYFMVPPDFYENIFDLQINNYKVIIAHPERYSYWHDDFSKLEDLKIRDVLFQINILSLSGYYSNQVKKVAERLIHHDMVEFAGSDLHNVQQLEFMRKALHSHSMEKLLKSGKLQNHLLM
jgi:protein-tyrosine phosphatase